MAISMRTEVGSYQGERLGRLIEQVDRLVSLPDVYYRLEALIERPDSNLDDIARLLSAEPDLCARLLRLANSAFYSFPVRIESIGRAVQIIGMRQIRELVLATSIANAFSRVPLGMIDRRGFWRHSVATGVMAKCIGLQAHRRQPERYYVAGLLHDIGRLAFFLKLPGLMAELLLRRERTETPLFLLEQAALGYNHAEAGAALLRHWRVPESIYEPVGFHHEPGFADEFAEVASAVHLADVWVNRELQGSGGERFRLDPDPEALDLLDIDEKMLPAVWSRAQDEITEVARQFLQQ
jgi:HD-like signal output (HDOD) protein